MRGRRSFWQQEPHPLACSDVQREVTLAQLFSWMLALLASVTALSGAALMVLADNEEPAALFGTGGFALLLWSAFHLTDRQPQYR